MACKAGGTGEAPVECQRCHRHKEFGHLDPDNLRWYCEDCWRSFSGERRTCFLCRGFAAGGAVDRADKRWYCNACWDRYDTGAAPRGAPRKGADDVHAPAARAAARSPPHRRSRSRSWRHAISDTSSPGPQLPSDSWRAPPLAAGAGHYGGRRSPQRGMRSPPRGVGPGGPHGRAAPPPALPGPGPAMSRRPCGPHFPPPTPAAVGPGGGPPPLHRLGPPPPFSGHRPPMAPHVQGGCAPPYGLAPPSRYGYMDRGFAPPAMYSRGSPMPMRI
uniref:Uncharacterized protein n=1 Tax=Alexandrium monilatum TaxID=311494 RepID=A0A7S4Q4F4_9DINO